MTDFDHILLFKTDIKTVSDKDTIALLLNADNSIEQWSIDQDDEDCVLRIVTHTLQHHQIINVITGSGYACCELT